GSGSWRGLKAFWVIFAQNACCCRNLFCKNRVTFSFSAYSNSINSQFILLDKRRKSDSSRANPLFSFFFSLLSSDEFSVIYISTDD
ncbi:MAG: hypothetical protein MUD08_07455, partial [Cytophagales bacterium]|nr:hypothetical protein [Cytophagales bacterium]